MGFYREVEKLLKDNSKNRLDTAIFYYGFYVKLYKAQLDDYSQAYGSLGGERHSYYKDIKGIIANDVNFESLDDAFSSNFEEGYFYSNSKSVEVGDLIKIVSEDGRQRVFKIDDKEGIGYTDEVFPRFIIIAQAG